VDTSASLVGVGGAGEIRHLCSTGGKGELRRLHTESPPSQDARGRIYSDEVHAPRRRHLRGQCVPSRSSRRAVDRPSLGASSANQLGEERGRPRRSRITDGGEEHRARAECRRRKGWTGWGAADVGDDAAPTPSGREPVRRARGVRCGGRGGGGSPHHTLPLRQAPGRSSPPVAGELELADVRGGRRGEKGRRRRSRGGWAHRRGGGGGAEGRGLGTVAVRAGLKKGRLMCGLPSWAPPVGSWDKGDI
jgi:hypothetical protein